MHDQSAFGRPPFWEMEIDVHSKSITIRWRVMTIPSKDYRSAIDELGSVLQMRLHNLARRGTEDE